MVIPLIITVVSMALFALAAWLTLLLGEWHPWLGIACAVVSFFVAFRP